MLITREEMMQMPERRRVHPFNDNGVRHSRGISDATGMARIGIHLVRLEPGRDSTTFHYHDQDEEFLYIISGRGIAEIGDETFEVGPGDFMGFTAPSPAHMLHNPFEEDLVYLMGGERNIADVVHYPRIGRTLVKSNGQRVWLHDSDGHRQAADPPGTKT